MGFGNSILDLKVKAMGKRKIFSLVVTIIMFFGFYFVSEIYLQKLYLFEWTSRHLYLGIWMITIGLILFNKILISFSITIGNFAGVVLGQYMGEWLRQQNMSKIVPGMNPQTVYQLQHHPGVEIWLLTIGVFFLLGLLLGKLRI